MDHLYVVLIALASALAAWFFGRLMLFSKFAKGSKALEYQYEVKLTRNSSHGIFSKVMYTGDDLQEAKRVYYTATGPARTTVELWTRGYHTASRRV